MEGSFQHRVASSASSTLPIVALARALALCACALWLQAGCVHYPDIADDCAAYGVAENHRPLGDKVILKPLYLDQLQSKCGSPFGNGLTAGMDRVTTGCVVPRPDGVVYAYYWVGDKCAMNHELCHVLHGVQHTEGYLEDLAQGSSVPYCPRNQLRLSANTGR